jgi:dTMP kinase
LVPGLSVAVDGSRPAEAEAEEEALAFHQRVRSGFRRLADSEPQRYIRLDATLPPEALHIRIRSLVAGRLEDHPADLAMV